MLFDTYKLRELTHQDPRYRVEAYYYILETLDFARTQLQLGRHAASESVPGQEAQEEEAADEPEELPSHITGQELCEALRIRAIWMFGFMAKTVLNRWGIRSTADVGEIVYNMVRNQKIRVTAEDSQDDFLEVYDFQKVFCDDFSIENEPHFPEPF